MNMLETYSQEWSCRKSWSRFTCMRSPGIHTLISVTQSEKWEGPRNSSLSILRGPPDTTRAPICHLPLLHLAAACQWILVPQTHALNLVGRGYNAIIVRGLVILHVSAHSHTDPSNNSRPSLHSIKEAIPMMKESMLCAECPLQKCRTFSRI